MSRGNVLYQSHSVAPRVHTTHVLQVSSASPGYNVPILCAASTAIQVQHKRSTQLLEQKHLYIYRHIR